jgi:hypothetical protein
MYQKYLKEKKKHENTKIVLDKAIFLAQKLLKEIHVLEDQNAQD